jgi:hypothetical protein
MVPMTLLFSPQARRGGRSAGQQLKTDPTYPAAPTRRCPPSVRDGRAPSGLDDAGAVLDRLVAVGVDMDEVGRIREDRGVAGFYESFARVLTALGANARRPTRG